MEAVLLVPDILDCFARGVFDQLERDRGGTAHFARDDYLVGRRQRLAGHTRLRRGAQEQIDHGIGDAIADFVRMAFAYGFAGEKIIGQSHYQVSG